eukprot:UN00533
MKCKKAKLFFEKFVAKKTIVLKSKILPININSTINDIHLYIYMFIYYINHPVYDYLTFKYMTCHLIYHQD